VLTLSQSVKSLEKLYLVAGVPRSGTTALYQGLSRSSFLRLSKPKEPHYLCKQQNEIRKTVFYAPMRSESDYLAIFRPARSIFPAVDCDPHSFQDLLAAEEAMRIAETVRVLVILRNPICRYISHYLMDFREGIETRLSTEVIEAELSSLSRSATNYNPFLWHSVYARWIRHWRDTIKSENLLFVRYEDIISDPLKASNQIALFFDIADLREVNLFSVHANASRQARNVLSRFLLRFRAQIPSLHQNYFALPLGFRRFLRERLLLKPGRIYAGASLEDRVRLRDYMADDIRETGDLLAWDVSEWLET
jgi:hypothetical protein